MAMGFNSGFGSTASSGGASLNNGIFLAAGGYGVEQDPKKGAGDLVTSAANPFQGQMDSFLGGASPAYRAPTNAQNRFETGLASSEKRLSSLLDDPNSIQQSAAYKFRVGQGEEALNRNLAAKGMAGSGNRLTELNDYAQGQASQEYGNQFGRLKDLTGMYAGNWNTAQGNNLNAATSVFGTQMQGHNARGNTLAGLYNNSANNASRESIAESSGSGGKGDWSVSYGGLMGQTPTRFNKRTGEMVTGGGWS